LCCSMEVSGLMHYRGHAMQCIHCLRVAGRMDSYVDGFMAAGGSLVTLAKGNRSRGVTNACRKHGGFYLGSIGGRRMRLVSSRCMSSRSIWCLVDALGVKLVHVLPSSSHFQHRPASGLQERTPLTQHLSSHKQQLRALGLQIIIHRTHMHSPTSHPPPHRRTGRDPGSELYQKG
jgi:hypothetical protein